MGNTCIHTPSPSLPTYANRHSVAGRVRWLCPPSPLRTYANRHSVAGCVRRLCHPMRTGTVSLGWLCSITHYCIISNPHQRPACNLKHCCLHSMHCWTAATKMSGQALSLSHVSVFSYSNQQTCDKLSLSHVSVFSYSNHSNQQTCDLLYLKMCI